MSFIFNATEYSPEQGGTKHPNGQFQVRVVQTDTKPGKRQGDCDYVIILQSNVGRQKVQFGVVQENQEYQGWARNKLSALCHAVEVFNLNIGTNGRELLNKELVVDIGDGKDPKYSEVKTYYDIRGEVPKARNGQALPQQNAAPAPNFAPAPQQPAQHLLATPQAQPQYAPQPNPMYAQQPPQGFQQPMPPMGNGQQFAPSAGYQAMTPPGFVANGAPSFDQSAAPQPSWASPPR